MVPEPASSTSSAVGSPVHDYKVRLLRYCWLQMDSYGQYICINYSTVLCKRGIFFTQHCCSPCKKVVGHILAATVVTGGDGKIHALIKMLVDHLPRSHPIVPIIRSTHVFETPTSNPRPGVMLFYLLWQQMHNLSRFITSHWSSSSTTLLMASFIFQPPL